MRDHINDNCVSDGALESESSSSILVVDDHLNVSKLVDAYLSKAQMSNVEIDHAISLEIAIEKISNNRPNVVLLDNLLPPHFDFRVSLESLRDVYDGPVILFSGELPENIGQYDIDKSLAGIVAKDDIGSDRFFTLVQKSL